MQRKLVRAALVGIVSVLLVKCAAAQNPAYGMVTHYLDPSMADTMVELGAGIVRVDFNWDQFQPWSGSDFDWAYVAAKDSDVDNARARGLTVFVTLSNTPGWANGGQGRNYPPYSGQDWYNFVFWVVQRYAGRVWHFGIWNEPDNTDNL